jgi:hypothetical protein
MWLKIGIALLTSVIVVTIPLALILNFKWQISVMLIWDIEDNICLENPLNKVRIIARALKYISAQ